VGNGQALYLFKRHDKPGRLNLKGLPSVLPAIFRLSGWVIFVGINFFAQFTRALKRDHLALGQEQIIAGGGISATALTLFLDAKFAEAADEHIFAVGKGIFDDFDQTFDYLGAFILWEG
jgi:hypothetical protein